jgi:hypothetical protein
MDINSSLSHRANAFTIACLMSAGADPLLTDAATGAAAAAAAAAAALYDYGSQFGGGSSSSSQHLVGGSSAAHRLHHPHQATSAPGTVRTDCYYDWTQQATAAGFPAQFATDCKLIDY